jgi:ribosomal protein S18 acetylase RimI-like enzyme
MHIALYKPANALDLVRMWRTSFEHGVGIKDLNPIADQVNFFVHEVVPRNVVSVVNEDGAIVAFLASQPASISHLYVRVQNIGQGIGTRLMALAKTESEGSLWLHTFTRNTHARRFYERHGFKEIGRESGNMYKIEAIKYMWLRGTDDA